MRVLVTGGSGFIGSAITRELLKGGHNVKVLDVNRPDSNVEFIKGDIMDKMLVEEAVAGCDAVIHLAAMIGVEHTDSQPVKTMDVSIDGMKNVLEAARKFKTKRVLFSSSSEVYGEPLKVPITETEPLKPKSAYGIGKLVSEWYLRSYSKEFGVPYTVVRFFNVYGPRQRPFWVVPRFISLALRGEPLTIYGNGNQIRAFCFVEDAAMGVVLALLGENGKNNEFNIGNGTEPVSIAELAEKIIKLSGSKSKIERDPEKTDRTKQREIMKRIPDTKKAEMLLSYRPEVSIEMGIKKTIEWVRGEI